MQYRNLTGLFFRTQGEDDKFINVCFEELPDWQRMAILLTEDDVYKNTLIERLVHTINQIGNDLDIVADE